MELNRLETNIVNKYHELLNLYNHCGNVKLLKFNEKEACLLDDSDFGVRNFESNIKNDSNSLYPLYLYDDFVVSVSLLKLLNQKKIKLTNKLFSLVPEIPYFNEVRFIDLLRNNTGIPDFNASLLTYKINNDQRYFQLNDLEKYIEDKKDLFLYHEYKDSLPFYLNTPLDNKPGFEFDGSDALPIIGVYLIELLSGLSYFEYIDKYIFKPLDIKINTNTNLSKYSSNPKYNRVLIPQEETNYRYITSNDYLKLFLGIREEKVVSHKERLLIEKPINYYGMATNINENNTFLKYHIGDSTILIKDQYYIFFVNNYISDSTFIDGCVEDGIYSVCRKISRLFINKDNLKLEKLNKKNVYEIADIKVKPEQTHFVNNGYYNICSSINDKNNYVYALLSEGESIGVGTLYINKEKQIYFINDVKIDRDFQGMGYGKCLLTSLLKELEKYGCESIRIGVNRFNIPAYRLYLSVGFVPDSTYATTMLLKYTFNK